MWHVLRVPWVWGFPWGFLWVWGLECHPHGSPAGHSADPLRVPYSPPETNVWIKPWWVRRYRTFVKFGIHNLSMRRETAVANDYYYYTILKIFYVNKTIGQNTRKSVGRNYFHVADWSAASLVSFQLSRTCRISGGPTLDTLFNCVSTVQCHINC